MKRTCITISNRDKIERDTPAKELVIKTDINIDELLLLIVIKKYFFYTL